MAYFAELRRRKWYRLNGMRNMIYVYSEILYYEWYNSLSDEDRQYLEEQKRKRREKEEAEFEMLMQRMGIMSMMTQTLNELSDMRRECRRK